MEEYKTFRINPNLTLIRMPGNVLTYLIQGTSSALLIDTGYGFSHFRTFIETLTKKPYEVLLTHLHVDHARGAGAFSKVWTDPRDLSLTEMPISEEQKQAFLKATGQDAQSLIPPIKKQDLCLLSENQCFDLGGLTVEATSLPGHTPGSIVPYIREQKIAIFGDACNPFTWLQVEGCLTVRQYRESLLAYNQRYQGKINTVLFSHGAPDSIPQSGFGILEEMIDVTELVLGRNDAAIPLPAAAGGGLLACPMDAVTMNRTDGKMANLVYTTANIG